MIENDFRLVVNSKANLAKTEVGSVTLSCDDHHRKLVGGLWDAFMTKRGVDFELGESSRGQSTVRAHRVVLDVFLSTEKLSVNASTDDHNTLLEFLYKGRVDVQKQRLSKLLEVAKETEFHILVDAIDSAANGKGEEKKTVDSDSSLARGDNNNQSDSSSDRKHLVLKNPLIPICVLGEQAPSESPDTQPAPSKVIRPKRKAGTPLKFVVYKTAQKKLVAIADDNGDDDGGGSDSDQASDWESSSKNPSTASTTDKKRGRSRGPQRCNICSKVFQHLCDLKRHSATHYRDKKYKCDVCGEGFRWLKALDAHLRSHVVIESQTDPTASEEKELQSDSPQSDVESDEKWGETEKKKKKKVVEPKRRYADAGSRRKGPHRCEVCSKEFRHLCHLKSHALTHQEPATDAGKRKGPHRCEACSLEFPHLSALRRHSLTHQDRDDRYTCRACGEKFRYLNALDAHLLTHPDTKTYKCSSCPKAFARYRHLKLHELVHGEDRPYMCHICSKTFLRSGDLQCHTASMHSTEKRFQCHQCGRAFALRRNLSSHLLSHAGAKPYKCDLCERAFSVRKNLLAHVRAHSGDKPFECSLCSRRFTSRVGLDDHKRLHTGERPFQCDGCSRAFVGKRFLRRHLRLGCVAGAQCPPDNRIQHGNRPRQMESEASPLSTLVSESSN